MRSREDSEERRRIGREWACGRHLLSPPSHLVSSSEGASGRNRRRSLANGQHDARLSRPGAVSGRGKEAQGFFGVVQKCIFQSRGLKISDLDEWRSPKRCDPERPPSCRGWLVASSLGTAATGGGYSWELESRNNGRAYSPCARLFWLPWGIFIMNSFFPRDAAPTPNEAPVCEAASASMQRPHLPHLPRGAAMASGIVVRPLDPWSCFSCRRFVSRSAESLTNTIPKDSREARGPPSVTMLQDRSRDPPSVDGSNKDSSVLFIHPERRD